MSTPMKYLIVFLVSMVPIVELRGAIPIGVGMGLPLVQTYILCVIGNMLPVPVIILFSKAVLIWCTRLPKVGPFFQKIYDKGISVGKTFSEKTGKYEYFALFTFVAIPLPGTGAWTGSLAATLLNMKFWPAVLSVMAGVLCAGLIMGAASAGLFGALGALIA